MTYPERFSEEMQTESCRIDVVPSGADALFSHSRSQRTFANELPCLVEGLDSPRTKDEIKAEIRRQAVLRNEALPSNQNLVEVLHCIEERTGDISGSDEALPKYVIPCVNPEAIRCIIHYIYG